MNGHDSITPRDMIFSGLRAGARMLVQNKKNLDRINVFPVADSDTGSNMSDTLLPLINATKIDPSDPGRMRDLSESLLLGARGNSGIILSSFLSGVLRELPGPGIYPDIIGRISRRGREQAYASVARPQRGTILSAVDAFEASAAANRAEMPGTGELVVLRDIADAVEKTRTQLDVLEDAGVVDAGALGFLVLMSGLFMTEAARAEKEYNERISSRIEQWLSMTPDLDAVSQAGKVKEASADARCLDMIIRTGGRHDPDLMSNLEELGSSVEIVDSGSFLKIHIHTDRFDDVQSWATQAGEIISWRTDHLQSHISDEAEQEKPAGDADIPVSDSSRIRIITDSSASLPAWLTATEGISMFHNYVRIDDRLVKDDEVDLRGMYRRMESGTDVTTARPSAEEVRRFIKEQLQEDQVLCYIAVGPEYTAGLELVQSAVDSLDARGRVLCFNTHAASGQQALVAVCAARKAGQDRSASVLSDYIDSRISLAKEYLVLDTLAYLAKGGRIGKLAAAAGNLLSVKPVVGHGTSGPVQYTRVRSREKGLEFIQKDIMKSFRDYHDLLLMVEDTCNPEWTEEVSRKLKQMLGFVKRVEILNVTLSASAGAHMGPGTWGVAVLPL